MFRTPKWTWLSFSPHSAARAACGFRLHAQAATGLLVGLFCLSTGCQSLVEKTPGASGDLTLPAMQDILPSDDILFPKTAAQTSPFRHVDGAMLTPSMATSESMSMESYAKIQQAEAQNSIVLQIHGDEVPFRLLPLPDDGRSVFVSELLRETGVQNRLGMLDVALFRKAPGAIEGVRMAVDFSNGKVVPTTDYGLRPGDRIEVRKKQKSAFRAVRQLILKR
ncbi:hypothetical protein SV7mr_07190 [Stieleria bergensis]|uniref:Uncharacterized protein n=1 Tax=Stieleria bergensis TaxID=2528025 RepID=A0A517SQ30_9BACT|nr:hypothetical protein SV7mr_07190 [Planctomycetes bacterium SV_7m_r]